MRAGGDQEVAKDDRDIVSAIRKKLADRVGKDRYEVWFGPATLLRVAGANLIVTSASQFAQNSLHKHFLPDLQAAACEAAGRVLSVEFRIDASLTDRTAQSVPAADASRASVTNGKAVPASEPSETAAAPPQPVRAAHEHRRRGMSLARFVVGNSNCLAFKSAEEAVERPGSYSPLFIYGPTGVGKTHLAEGILNEFKRRRRQSSGIILSAEQFTSSFLEALRGSGLPSFRRKYRDVELLIIDDVQFFANKRATVVELQHTMETVLRAGHQLVLTSDRSPAALKLGPEIISRLTGGVVSRIEAPDYPTRLGIVKQLAADFELNLPEEVQSFIATRLTLHARQLCGAIKRLHATTLVHHKSITLHVAEEALADLIHTDGQAVRLPDIEKAICSTFGLEPQCLHSQRKSKTVSHPRMLAMWLARKHTRAALSEIGKYFGQRTHSTVISASQKIETWMAAGSELQFADRNWSLDEAIRRVEESLRAG